MGFFRSSESKSSKHKSRFSFRRHSDDAAEVSPPTKPSTPPLTRKTRSSRSSRSDPSRPPAHPHASSSTPAPSAANLRGTIVSSASTSTSASSSISSPTALQRAADEAEIETQKPLATTANSKRTSDSLASTDTDDSADFIRTPSECSFLATPRESFENRLSMDNSRIPDASVRTSPQQQHQQARHSLVAYSKLQCSMSYKNRMAQGSGADDPLLSTPSSNLRASSSSLRASFNTGGRRSESGRSSSSRMSRGSGSYHHHSRESSGLSHIDELSTAVPPPSSSSSASSSAEEPPSSNEPTDPLLGGRMSELRLNEASVAALQTRRAFQQMVLSMEDDGDSSDYDSEDDSYSGRSSNYNSGGASGGVVSLGADDYRKFQFRLRQLEELTAEQASRQAKMEETIEQEVTARTKKVVDAMEKKIAMYKQAKDLEVEREIQRRLSTEGGRMTNVGGRESSFYAGHMPLGTPPTLSTPRTSNEDLKGKPLDKIFHPRRTRRRMEMLREREEQQKREMEQFREFIRNTELHSVRATRAGSGFPREGSETMCSESARASIKALRDPHITEDLLSATQNELIEMICVLRKHVSVQETQLDEAKRLISAAIEAREEAEETAREAVELTLELDTRLERASQEMVVIKDELRRSSDFSMRSSYLFSSKSLSSGERNSQVSVSVPNGAPNASSRSSLPRNGSFPNF